MRIHTGRDNAVVKKEAKIKKIINEMTSNSLGAVCIVDDKSNLEGIITNGDLRRTFDEYEDKIFDIKANEIMTKHPITTCKNELAFNTLKLMEERKSQISVLPVVDKKTN